MLRYFAIILYVFAFAVPASANELYIIVAKTKAARDKQYFKVEDVAKIEELLSRSKDEKLNLDTNTLLGNTYLEIESYDVAYNHYLNAIELAAKYKLYKKAAYISERMGIIQRELGNYPESLKLYNDALDYHHKSKNIRGILTTKGNIAVVKILLGDADEAIAILTQIKNEKGLDRPMYASTYLTLGNIYLMNLTSPDQAIYYYLKALDLSEPQTEFRVMALQNLAESYLKLKEYDTAYRYNKESEGILKVFDNDELKASLYLFYAQIYEAKGNFTLAFKNQKLYQQHKALSDNSAMKIKVQNLEGQRKIRHQELQLKINRQKIVLLEQQNTIDQSKKGILLFVVAFSIAVACIFIRKSRKKIQQLGHNLNEATGELEFSQEKIDKMVLTAIEEKEFAEDFKSKLKNIRNTITDPEMKAQLGTLLSDFQNLHMLNKNENDLVGYAESKFQYRLEKRYPDLSEDEKRICTLIYLDLKNKEITALMNLSLRSVENMRYRIRKKFGLDTTDNLYDYLKSI